MAKLEHYYTQFEEGKFYHVYNRTIDKKLMFKDEEDHKFFMTRLNFFLKDLVSVYVHNLLENHFHLLIKIKDDLTAYRQKHKIDASICSHYIISKQFRRFFQSYTLKFNYKYKRCGTLFQTPFKRSCVKDHQYLTHLIYYIHTNPQKHGLIDDFKNWKWSSYHEVLSESNNDVHKEILQWFGNEIGYINFHTPRIKDFDNL